MKHNEQVRKFLKEQEDIFGKEKSFGLEFLADKKEPYRFNLGRMVSIDTAGHESYAGIYRGTNGYELVLFPYVNSQNESEPDSDKDKMNKERVYIWSDRPALLKINAVSAICPMDEAYLMEFVARRARNPDKKIIC